MTEQAIAPIFPAPFVKTYCPICRSFCRKQGCMLFDVENDQCSILSLIESITVIRSSIQNIDENLGVN